jgi:choloylglycine hydrolase
MYKSLIKCYLVSLLSFIFIYHATACTVFVFSSDSTIVYGQNLDWKSPIPGLVFINPRGIQKSVLHWKGHWPADGKKKDVFWTSRYVSVTFSCYGRDFIDGGMNEVGLIVDETNLTAKYSPEDDRPGISCQQWMQYQLDNYATVEEVLEHLDELRHDGEGWHYLIADKSGDCAIIEYLNGTAVVHRATDIRYQILTNTTYEQALSHIPMDIAFGGKIDIASGRDAYGNFVHVAALMRDFNQSDQGNAVEFSFHLLSEVSSEYTRRSVVYNSTQNRVLWKTKIYPQLRWFDLNMLDFSQDDPVQYIDVNSNHSGILNDYLMDYTVEVNKEIVEAVLGLSNLSESTMTMLTSRGYTPEDVLDAIALHPTKARRQVK